MSKLEEVLNKKAKLVERKFKDAKQTAKEAGLTAAIAATTVLGLGTTASCNRSDDSSTRNIKLSYGKIDDLANEPKVEAADTIVAFEAGDIAKETSEKLKAEEEKLMAQKLFEEIEKSGVPTVKKDKQGNVTKVLSSIESEGYASMMMFSIWTNNRKTLDAVIIYEPIEGMGKFKNPRYMSVHRDAYTEKYADGSEKHNRAKDYDIIPDGCSIFAGHTKVVDAQRDTLYTPKKVGIMHGGSYTIRFCYPEKQNTQTNLNMQTLAQNHGGRGE